MNNTCLSLNGWLCSFMCGAFCAQSFYHVINALNGKSIRQLHDRYVNTFQAKGTMTLLTIEMSMLFTDGAVTVVAAYGVF